MCFQKGHKIRLGQKHTKETKIKMSKSHKGKKLSEEHKEKISKTLKEWKGQTYHFIKGMKWNKISKNRQGEKNPNWKGGISKLPYSVDWTETLKRSIRERDNYICQKCSIYQDELNNGQIKKLDIHHIDYDKQNCNPNNLITLCRRCNTKVNKDRNYWTNYFQQFLLFKGG